MPEITFEVDHATGESSLKIKGIRGAGCKPIHNAVSADLKAALGINEIQNVDTDEMRQVPTVTAQRQVRTR